MCRSLVLIFLATLLFDQVDFFKQCFARDAIRLKDVVGKFLQSLMNHNLT